MISRLVGLPLLEVEIPAIAIRLLDRIIDVLLGKFFRSDVNAEWTEVMIGFYCKFVGIVFFWAIVSSSGFE